MMMLAAAEPAVRLEQVWARATSPSATAGGAYLTIVNDSDKPDALVSARSDVAESVELHTHVTGPDGRLHMTEVQRVEVPAHSRVNLKPGGFHLMLFELKRRMVLGATFAVTVTLEKSGEIIATGTVRDAAAMASTP